MADEGDKIIQNKSKEFYLSFFPLHSKIFTLKNNYIQKIITLTTASFVTGRNLFQYH